MEQLNVLIYTTVNLHFNPYLQQNIYSETLNVYDVTIFMIRERLSGPDELKSN